MRGVADVKIYTEPVRPESTTTADHLAASVGLDAIERPRESLAAWIADGGTGQQNVLVDKAQQLIVDTPDSPSSRAVTLDWLRVDGDPLMRRVQLATIDRATGLAYAGDAVTAEYLVGGARQLAAASIGPPLAGQAADVARRHGAHLAHPPAAWAPKPVVGPEHGAAARLRRPTRHAVAAGTTAPAGGAGPLPAVAGRWVGVPFSAGARPARARPPVSSAETSRHANVAAASRGYVTPMSHATVPRRRPRRAHRFVDRRQA